MPDDDTVDDHLSPVATTGGRLLAVATRAVASVRPAAKPLHPRGRQWAASVTRAGGWDTGAPWLDEAATHEALVRRSRAAGLPPGWPDVHGLAVRVALRPDDGTGDTAADILLSTTGRRVPARFLLRPGRRPDRMFYGSLLPYRTPRGPVLLGARWTGGPRWDLLAATPRGDWTSYGELVLGEELPDAPVAFDAVLNRPPGLEQYDAVARLRAPSYRTARRSRRNGSRVGTGHA